MNSEALAQELERSGDYRILRRMVPKTHYADPDDGLVGRAMVVDVETTGLDLSTDAIIEFAAIPFTYNSESGRIFDLGPPLAFLQDPQRPIPADITRLTGITDAMVAGRSIDHAAIADVAKAVDLVIAHNASFDRNMVQSQIPFFKDMPWACSIREIPWREKGLSSGALDYLLTQHCLMFYDGHRAVNDCQAVIQLLVTPFESGELPFKLLLHSARMPTIRIWAVDAPFDFKDVLKARSYRWNNGDDRRPRAWYKDIPEKTRDEELSWLKENAYRGRTGPVKIEVFDAKSRYSV